MTEQEYLERLERQEKRTEELQGLLRDMYVSVEKMQGIGMLGFQAAATVLSGIVMRNGVSGESGMRADVNSAIEYAQILLQKMGYVK